MTQAECYHIDFETGFPAFVKVEGVDGLRCKYCGKVVTDRESEEFKGIVSDAIDIIKNMEVAVPEYCMPHSLWRLGHPIVMPNK